MEDKNIVSWHCSELPTSLSPNVSGWSWELLPPGRAAGSPRLCSRTLKEWLQLLQPHPAPAIHSFFHGTSNLSIQWFPQSLPGPVKRPLLTSASFAFHSAWFPWRIPSHNIPLDSPALEGQAAQQQHLLKGRCYTLSSFWFYILISVFWIKGRRVASLWFLAIFSA